jgi:hypothetical protein
MNAQLRGGGGGVYLLNRRKVRETKAIPVRINRETKWWRCSWRYNRYINDVDYLFKKDDCECERKKDKCVQK